MASSLFKDLHYIGWRPFTRADKNATEEERMTEPGLQGQHSPEGVQEAIPMENNSLPSLPPPGGPNHVQPAPGGPGAPTQLPPQV